MELRLTVCDICEDPTRSTTTYTISTADGRTASTDRCDEHGELLEQILNHVEEAVVTVKRAGKSPAKRTQGAGIEVKRERNPSAATAAKRTQGGTTGGTRRGRGINVTSMEDIDRKKRGR